MRGLNLTSGLRTPFQRREKSFKSIAVAFDRFEYFWKRLLDISFKLASTEDTVLSCFEKDCLTTKACTGPFSSKISQWTVADCADSIEKGLEGSVEPLVIHGLHGLECKYWFQSVSTTMGLEEASFRTVYDGRSASRCQNSHYHLAINDLNLFRFILPDLCSLMAKKRCRR